MTPWACGERSRRATPQRVIPRRGARGHRPADRPQAAVPADREDRETGPDRARPPARAGLRRTAAGLRCHDCRAAARYMEVAELDVSTRETYEGYIRRTILPALGSMELRKLRGPVLDMFYARLRRCGNLACTGVGAENPVTAADLVSPVGRVAVKLGIRLREGLTFRHFQYPCHYVSRTLRCSAHSAGLPCPPGQRVPKRPRSLSCATRSPFSNARLERRGCPGLTGRS